MNSNKKEKSLIANFVNYHKFINNEFSMDKVIEFEKKSSLFW